MTSPKWKSVGIVVRGEEDVFRALLEYKNLGGGNYSYNFICISPILNPKYVKMVLEGKDTEPLSEPFGWHDLTLSSSEWSQSVVGCLTDVNFQLNSKDFSKALRARKLLQQEIEFGHHIMLPAVLVELRNGNDYTNLARIIHAHSTNAHQTQQVWVKVPMQFDSEGMNGGTENDGELEWVMKESWHLWNKFRTLCNTEYKVCVVLDLPSDLPEDNVIDRWLGETVRAIFISTACFTTNAKGFPILSPRHQVVVKKFVEMGAQVIIDPKGGGGGTNLGFYRQYTDFLLSGEWKLLSDNYAEIAFASGYEDYLQCPLQPLQDNLESQTYEVFEKDPIKYQLYAQAIRDALLDMIADAQKDTRTAVVMVVGAGRGPLIRSTFNAAAEAQRNVKVYAVEKNINAANTILHMNASTWGGKVTVVNMDMRNWNAPEQADIIVSELLGSFGDNELSPECLDGAQRFLKPSGIMIPQSYRSYLAPVMSSKLYNEARRFRDYNKNCYSQFETPYVVHMKNKYIIAQPQKLFTFVHPKPDVTDSNDRYSSLSFCPELDCVIHGFAGYFECTLYNDILMSILPETFSEGMFSWFPIFFPLREPVQLQKDNQLTAHFWRLSSRTTVWYEWTITSPESVPIHNPNGRSYTIGL